MSTERICLATAHGGTATDTDAANLIRHVARYRFAIEQLGPPCLDVLDIACGTGYGTHLLHIAGHRAYGVDKDPSCIAYAQAAYPALEFSVQDSYTLTLPRRFGGLVCLETLEHLDRPEAAMAQIVKCLSPGAVAILSSPINRLGVTGPSHTNRFHPHEFARDDFVTFVCDWFVEADFYHQEDALFAPLNGDTSGFALAVARGPKI